MRNYKYNIVLSVWLAVLLFAGCADNEGCLPQGSNGIPSGAPEVTAYVRLSLFPGGKAQARSTGNDTVHGTDGENKITSLTVFLIGTDGNGEEDWSNVQYGWFTGLALSETSGEASGSTAGNTSGSSSGISYTARVKTKAGRKKIYVGANLTPNQVTAFVHNNSDGKGLYASLATGYAELVSELAAPTKDGIVMFGQGSGTIEVTDGNGQSEETALSGGEIELTRVVAKVLLTCDVQSSGNSEYVNLSDNTAGWIKRTDVRYQLQTLNRKLYLVKQPGNADPNYKLSDYIRKIDGNNYEACENVADEFIRTTDHSGAITDFPGVAEAYSADKLPGTATATPYTGGLYCPENTTTADDYTFTDAEKRTIPLTVTTYMVVAVKYIPKKITTESGEQALSSPDDITALLPEVTQSTTGLNGKTHAAGTYFSKDMKTFYSYEGMQKAITQSDGTLTDKDFMAYEGGTGYFYTYIDGEQPTDGSKGLIFSSASGLLRNRYYILRVTEMGIPAPMPVELIKVNTRVLDWVAGGQGTITVKP